MNRLDEPNPSGKGPQPSTATSRSLMERVKVGDTEAWDRLVGLYAPLVYRWCRRWNLPEQDCADVFQEVFKAVATHLAGFRKEKTGDTFRGWLRTIVRNKVHDHFRKLDREPAGTGGTDAQIRFSMLPEAQAPDDNSGEERAERILFQRTLDMIRDEFEDRTWEAFWLTTVEDRAPSEVGLELGMSSGAVRVAKSRVLRRLREELGDL
jgi:RNA polymerase sigma-70 factor (ECF subfamily)